jgi:tripartite ATP-independent transporter DctM subunit
MWWETLLFIFAGLMLLFATGLPIFACFMIINVVAVLWLMGTAGVGLFVNSMLETSMSEALVAIPMFVLLGELLFRTGGVRVLFEAFDSLIGKVRGRLYIISVLVAGFLGAISGSTIAAVAVLGRFIYPTMIERGCDKRLSMGTILSGATLDAIIPPSIVGIILATLTNLSIGDFLVAGIGPGITLAACFIAYVLIRVTLNPALDSRGDDLGKANRPTSERLRAALPVFPLFGIVFLVLGLVMFGIAQPTEAAAAGVVGAIALSLTFGTFSFRMIGETCYGAAITTGTVLIIIASSKLFSQLLAFTGAATGLVELAVGLDLNPWIIYVVMMLVVFILCMFIDQLALMLIIVPIYMPIVAHLGFDPLWFWMMFLINIMFGGITPPLGYTVFVFITAVPGAKIVEVYRAALPMVGVAFVAIIIMTLTPSIVTFLPSLR